jgi:adenylosuccinate lyase
MLRNLEASHGLVFSGRALLRMVEAGISRERAYEIVQRNAMAAWDREVPLRGLLEADPEVAGVLDASELDAIFDLDALLVHVDEIFDRTLRRPEVAHA